MKVLVLAGTSDGREVAGALHARGHRIIASLAGATAHPRATGVPTRIGGFGGAEGFAGYLSKHGINAVIDATHPFARRIGPRSAAVCAGIGVPYLRLLRPEWQAGSADRWHRVSDEAEAARLVPEQATVFLATGAQRLESLAGLKARKVVLRVADPPDAPLPWEGAEFIVGPPGNKDEEVALFRRAQVTWMIARNAGGPARAKLDAAREMGIDVAMIKRPELPDAPLVRTVAEAVDWVETL